MRELTAVVLVLGDLGRSPRMQYHALSLAARPHTRVFLVGFRGEKCVPEVMRQPDRIQQILMSPDLLPRPKHRMFYLIYAPLKAFLLLWQLLWVLFVIVPRTDVLLCQSPPAIPTLAAAWLMRILRGTRVVVDWHNLAFSVLQHGGLAGGHPFVRLSRWYERQLGSRLNAPGVTAFCLTPRSNRPVAVP